MEALLSEPYFSRRINILSRPDGFMLSFKLGVDFSSTSKLLYPKIKNWLQLLGIGSSFWMKSDKLFVNLRIVDSSLYTRRIALGDGFRLKRRDMLACTQVEFNYLETLAKIFIIPAIQDQFIRGKHFEQCSSSSDCYCDEYKLRFYWILQLKSILASPI